MRGHAAVVSLLLTHNADIQQSLRDGLTELHIRALVGDMEGVQRVLQTQQAAINARNAFGESAVKLARRQGQTSVVDYLLQNGANPRHISRSLLVSETIFTVQSLSVLPVYRTAESICITRSMIMYQRADSFAGADDSTSPASDETEFSTRSGDEEQPCSNYRKPRTVVIGTPLSDGIFQITFAIKSRIECCYTSDSFTVATTSAEIGVIDSSQMISLQKRMSGVLYQTYDEERSYSKLLVDEGEPYHIFDLNSESSFSGDVLDADGNTVGTNRPVPIRSQITMELNLSSPYRTVHWFVDGSLFIIATSHAVF